MKRKLVTMRRAAGIGLLLLVVAVVGLVAVWPETPPPPARVASIGDLEQYLSALVRFGRPPGLALAVVKDGRVAYSRGFGLADGPRHLAATPDTIYR
jgi:CubicO group peptidase (beta-lactamase class C family)